MLPENSFRKLVQPLARRENGPIHSISTHDKVTASSAEPKELFHAPRRFMRGIRERLGISEKFFSEEELRYRRETTLTERHPDWPTIVMKTDYYAHGTQRDLYHLRDTIRNSQASIYFYEDSANPRRDFIQGILQSASDAEPLSSPSMFIATANRELGIDIYETPILDMLIHVVHGTGVVVSPLDTNPGDQKGETPFKRPKVEEDFEQTLVNIREREKKVAEYTKERDEIAVNIRLEDALENIFTDHPELKRLKTTEPDGHLVAVVSRGTLHKEVLTPYLNGQGIITEDISDENHFLSTSATMIKKFLAGEEPAREDLIRARMEQMLKDFRTEGFTDNYYHTAFKDFYLTKISSQFSEDEVRKLHQLDWEGTLTLEDINHALNQKGLKDLPVTIEELVSQVESGSLFREGTAD